MKVEDIKKITEEFCRKNDISVIELAEAIRQEKKEEEKEKTATIAEIKEIIRVGAKKYGMTEKEFIEKISD